MPVGPRFMMASLLRTTLHCVDRRVGCHTSLACLVGYGVELCPLQRFTNMDSLLSTRLLPHRISDSISEVLDYWEWLATQILNFDCCSDCKWLEGECL